jgi:acyl-CoA thioesterase FadM
MTRWLRFLITFLKSLAGPKLDLNSEQRLQFRVWLNDTELKYVNNSAVLIYAGFGRIDYMVRTGLLRMCLKEKVFAALATTHVIFRRSLKRFQKLELRSKLIYWDNNHVWIEQNIFCKIKGDWKLSNTVIVKSVFKKGRHTIPIHELLNHAGFSLDAREKPSFIQDLERAEQSSWPKAPN